MPFISILGFLKVCICSMLHLEYKHVPFLHNTVLILCNEGAGLVAVTK